MEWELINQRKRREAEKHENFRKELWIGVAVAVSRADTAKTKSVPATWADYMLKEFDQTFKPKDQ